MSHAAVNHASPKLDLLEGRSPWRKAGMAALVLVALAPAAWRLVAQPARDDIAIEPGATVLRYMAWGNPEQLEVERDIIRRFNAHQRHARSPYRVQLFMPPAGGYEQKLRVMLATGTAPDVIRADHYYFPSLVPKGYFRDLSAFADDDQKAQTFRPDDFHPVAMEENYHEGRLYGLNVMFGPPVCYYNKDLFLKAGLDDPYTQWRQGRWTWESFVHAAQALTVRDPNGRALRYGFLMPGALGGAPPHWAWFVWLWGEGGALLSAPDPSRPRVSLFDTPEALAAFGAMRDLRFKKCVTPTLTDGAASAFTFESGKVGMEFSFSGSAPRYRNITDFKWDIAPIPYRVTAREGRRTVVPYALVKGNQLVVSANSPNPRAAWEFVKYATSYEAERILYGDTHRRNVPTRLNLLSSHEDYIKASRPPYHIDIYKDLLDCGMELPIDYAWPAWTSEAARHLEKLFVDPDADLQQVLRTTKIAVDRVLAAEFERMKRYVKKEPDAR